MARQAECLEQNSAIAAENQYPKKQMIFALQKRFCEFSGKIGRNTRGRHPTFTSGDRFFHAEDDYLKTRFYFYEFPEFNDPISCVPIKYQFRYGCLVNRFRCLPL